MDSKAAAFNITTITTPTLLKEPELPKSISREGKQSLPRYQLVCFPPRAAGSIYTGTRGSRRRSEPAAR